MMNIGSTIKNFRLKRNLTLEEVSEETGLSLSYLSYLERGKRNINFPALEKISSALALPLPVLVFLSASQAELDHDKSNTLLKLQTQLHQYINNDINSSIENK